MRAFGLALIALIGLWPAWAPAGAQSELGLNRDSDQPIEINADSLEVDQTRQLAIFRGNVDATQGRIRLRADELQVHYRSDAKGRDATADASGNIVRIDAIGRVLVTSPSETAQGDLGVYDVAAKEITLTGAVVLTRGENVIRGQRLVLNMRTGQSRIGGGRVRGLFRPNASSKP